MWTKWWQNQARKRMAAAARKHTPLRFETLEERDNPTAIFAVGAEAGAAPIATVFNAATQQQLFTVNAYDASFTGGVRVAVGDVNGDGTSDLITGTGVGGSPIVRVFSGVDGSLLRTLTVGDGGSRNGVSVSAADINGDGISEIIVGTTLNNQANVQVIQFSDGATIQSFTPFDGSGLPGVSVSAGDFNGDGIPDIAVGAAANTSPRVQVIAGRTNTVLFNTFAFEQSFLGGVNVSMANLNADQFDDLIVSAGNSGGPRVQIFSGGTGAVFQNFFAYGSTLRNGAFAGALDTDGNGSLEIVTMNGVGQTPQVKAFNSTTLAELSPPSFTGLPVASFLTSAPTTTVATTTPGPTTTTPITFTITFSELMNGFAQSDITVTGGSITGFTKTSDTLYTVLVTPAGASSVSVSVAANVATDAAGNGNAASNTSTVIVDNSAPTATITSSVTSPTNTSPIPFTITFNEAITGLTLDDFVITNGTATSGSLQPTNNTTFTFTVDADGQGPVTVTLPAGAVTDNFGNVNAASNTISITFDTDGPATTVNSPAPPITSTSPIPFSVNFSEAVADFTEADITVVNGTVTAGSFGALSTQVYSFTITPNGDGDVIVSVAAGVASDAAGNPNAAAVPVTRTYDTTAPAAPVITGLTPASDTGTSDSDGITNNTTPTIAGTGEVGATIDVVIDGNQAGMAIVLGDGTWTFPITVALSDGSHTATATQTDGAGNISPVSNSFTITIDTTQPTAVLSTTAPSTTNSVPIPMSVTFNEEVSGLSFSSISITNGTASDVATSDNLTFTFNVIPSAAGDVIVTVGVNAAQDVAGNGNTTSNDVTVTFNGTGPVATADPLLTGDSTPTLTGTVEATAVTVTVTVNGVTYDAVVSGTDWTADITDTLPDGTYDVVLVATDNVGDSGVNTITGGLVIDSTAPGVTVSSTAAPATNTSPIPFTITFTEDVTNFVEGDITVVGGTIDGGSFAGSGSVYSFTVTPDSDGNVIVSVAAGVAEDGVGNLNTVSNDLTVSFDSTAPDAPVIAGLTAASDTGDSDTDGITSINTPTITGTGEVGSTVTVSIDSTEAGTAIVQGDGTWTFTPAAALGEGDHTATATQTDAAGNTSVASNEFTFTIDTTAPSANLTTTATSTTSTAPIPFTVTFDEAVSGLTLGDIAVTNGTASVLSAQDSQTFTFVVTPLADGLVTVLVSAGAAQDVAGNDSAVSNSVSVTFESTGPVATADSLTTNDTTPTLTGTVEAGAVSVSVTVNGVTYDAAVVDTDWTADITDALADGTYDVVLIATDALGNSGLNSITAGLIVDTQVPTATVASTAAPLTNTTPIPFSVTFSEPVTDFLEGDISVTGGTVDSGSFTGNGQAFSFTVTPTGEGDVIVSVAAAVASDAAGNNNTASNDLTVTFDSTAPDAPVVTGLEAASDTGSSDTDGITNDTTPTLTGTGEVGATVTVSIDASQAGTAIVQGDGTWTFTPTNALAEGDHTATATQTDEAGNTSAASNSFTFTVDTTGTTPVVATSAGTQTSTDPIPFTAAFGEVVTDFDESDITVTGGSVTASSLVDDGNGNYSFTVTPTGAGTVTVSIAAGVAVEVAGNENAASNEVSIEFV